ncbi:MAG: hypothetical protein ACKO66_07055 [Flavobacteriales bacterium]
MKFFPHILLLLICALSHQICTSQNRWNLALEGTLSESEYYRASPISLQTDFQFASKRRCFIRSGLSISTRDYFKMTIPVIFGFYTHPASRNHLEVGIGMMLEMHEELPPYDAFSNYTFGPSGIIFPLAWRHEFPKGWYSRVGLSPFIVWEVSVIPTCAIGYRLGLESSQRVQPE